MNALSGGRAEMVEAVGHGFEPPPPRAHISFLELWCSIFTASMLDGSASGMTPLLHWVMLFLHAAGRPAKARPVGQVWSQRAWNLEPFAQKRGVLEQLNPTSAW